MSKQYLTLHRINNAHGFDIFSLAATPTQVISGSGSSDLLVHATKEPDFPREQLIQHAHRLGCHHLVTSANGAKLASAGFDGQVKLWTADDDGQWHVEREIVDGVESGGVWAIALSHDGRFLASTTQDGRINVWDNDAEGHRIREYSTNRSFGTALDLSSDGKLTASGHEDGSVWMFNNDSGRLSHRLPGLVKMVRAVKFSPGCTFLAAAGDDQTIALYDVVNGEHIANWTGHGAWIMSLDWSSTGEFLLSGAFDGRAKVWSIEQGECVATHSDSSEIVWAVKWLPKTGNSEHFALAGANRTITFYREAAGD